MIKSLPGGVNKVGIPRLVFVYNVDGIRPHRQHPQLRWRELHPILVQALGEQPALRLAIQR